jgi:hypothetical protein
MDLTTYSHWYLIHFELPRLQIYKADTGLTKGNICHGLLDEVVLHSIINRN